MTITSLPGSITKPRVDFDADVETNRETGDPDYGGWFCVQTDPWPCPVDGCDFVALYMTAAHLVIVWPRIDDPSLLANAANAKLAGRDPRVTEYAPEFGRAIAYDEWARIGRPVHGVAVPPPGYSDGAKKRL